MFVIAGLFQYDTRRRKLYNYKIDNLILKENPMSDYFLGRIFFDKHVKLDSNFIFH